ncbi:hypothetical protein [Nostoc sp.]|uniref:hypothetical protein n=1 Tax=Nostoc sp. TaxID=1180 RepID=UPI002FF5E837
MQSQIALLITLDFMQVSFDLSEAVRYSIGLVIFSLLVLILLWLPDILKEK